MAAIQALASLVHCPVNSNGLQSLCFPLAEAMQGPDANARPQHTAAIQTLLKVPLVIDSAMKLL